MHPLDERSEAVLRIIIAEYAASGEPVGSRTVSKDENIHLSAASIRNIMGDLSDWGYITQPHVSAGRIPTDRAYRFYVDAMLARRRPRTEKENPEIESLIASGGLDVRDLLKQSSSVLAGLSSQAGVVAAIAAVEQTFKTIDFIKVAEDRILVVLVSTSGFVQNKMIYDEDDVDQEVLERYSRMLNDMLKDLDLRQARERIEKELATEKARVDSILAKVLRLGHVILCQEASREIFIEGQANILNEPEFSRIEDLRALLITFQEKSKLLKILDKTLEAGGIQIFIGSEHGLGAIETCSIVAHPIRPGDKAVGSLGIIGPKRMDYNKVISVVGSTGRVLTRLLKKVVESAV